MHLLLKRFTYKETEKMAFIDEKIYMNLAGPDDVHGPVLGFADASASRHLIS